MKYVSFLRRDFDNCFGMGIFKSNELQLDDFKNLNNTFIDFKDFLKQRIILMNHLILMLVVEGKI